MKIELRKVFTNGIKCILLFATSSVYSEVSTIGGELATERHCIFNTQFSVLLLKFVAYQIPSDSNI